MWLSKFLDLEEDLKKLRSKIKEEVFDNIKKHRLTPLEFTIIECIFNSKRIYGYDLIRILNEHFAGTWTAQSGTIYPILSKLKKNGFLKIVHVKSDIGPIKKVYSLTEAGEAILKEKVNKHFQDQLNFVENFLVELASVYIHSFSEEKKDGKISEVQNSIKTALENVIKNIPPTVQFKALCPNCGVKLDRNALKFCSECGTPLTSIEDTDE
ncbi:MAG: helix-turn-helix transcriptional regulator [Promethearchaeota archaeon]|nr:MAG: helix-turn-helix transcriptional regulator [Candidatus Lokiarchaeota archaeon]